jgi:hypothetical protein
MAFGRARGRRLSPKGNGGGLTLFTDAPLTIVFAFSTLAAEQNPAAPVHLAWHARR